MQIRYCLRIKLMQKIQIFKYTKHWHDTFVSDNLDPGSMKMLSEYEIYCIERWYN